MSLRDEHLEQALKNAPDRDAAPSDTVRKKVLGYAENTLEPRRLGFLKRCLKWLNAWQITSWQLVGVSSVASVLFVTVLLRNHLPDKSVWLNTDEQELAQKKAESAPMESPQKEVLTESIANDVGDAPIALSEPIAETQISNQIEDKQTKAAQSARKKKAVSMQLTKEIEKPAVEMMDESDIAPASSPAVIADEESPDALESSVVGSAKKADGVADVIERSKITGKDSAAARTQILSNATKTASGAALAEKDIQAGKLRILSTKNAWSKMKPLLDDETGLNVELVEDVNITISNEELDKYNQTMRDWYHNGRLMQ